MLLTETNINKPFILRNMPQISVCIAVYNVEKYIRKCVLSLFNQTLKDMEYIFVDDSSTDDSITTLNNLLEEYPEKKPLVRIIHNKRNEGPGLTRYKAGTYATGDFIYFPDADDWLETDMLETLYFAAMQEKADLVVCQRIFETDSESKYVRKEVNLSNDEWKKTILIYHKINMPLYLRLIKRNLYEKAVQDYPLCRLTRFEDYLISAKVHFYSQRTIGIDKWLYHYNTVNQSSITKQFQEIDLVSGIIVADNLGDFIKKEFNKAEYLSLIAGLKLQIKKPLITHHQFWSPERWRLLWPETNSPKFILHSSFLSYYHDILIFLVNHRMDKTAYLFMNMISQRITRRMNRHY